MNSSSKEDAITKIIYDALVAQDKIYNCEEEGTVLTFTALSETLAHTIASIPDDNPTGQQSDKMGVTKWAEKIANDLLAISNHNRFIALGVCESVDAIIRYNLLQDYQRSTRNVEQEKWDDFRKHEQNG